MNTALPALQTALQDFVLHGVGSIEKHVRGTERVPVGTRLAIYASAYRTRLIGALESNFPVLARFMDTDEFQVLARRYIEQHEPTQRSVRWYGEQLARYLTVDARYRDAPVLADLATWEWAMTEVFDAADAPTLKPGDLVQRAPEEWADLRLVAHPSMRRVDLAWNAPQIWKALQEGAVAPKPECRSPPECWLLWRQELKIFFRALDPLEALALQMLCAGKNFGELCEGLSMRLGEKQAPFEAASLLRGWVEAGLLTASSPTGDKTPRLPA